MQKSFLNSKDGTDLLCHHAKFGGVQSLCGAGVRKRLIVCMSVMLLLLNGKFCEHVIARKPFELRNDLDTIPFDRGKVCMFASAFSFVSVPQGQQ